MKKNFLCLDYFNKIAAATPLFLFVGCDGSRGDELGIMILATLVLALLLSLVEPRYRKAESWWIAAKVALFCAAATVLLSMIELIVIWKMGKLHGPIGYYGITSVIFCASGILLIFAILSSWADREKIKN